ncbi:hypothetical protein Tco_0459988 [Tanacetum coccineum]
MNSEELEISMFGNIFVLDSPVGDSLDLKSFSSYIPRPLQEVNNHLILVMGNGSFTELPRRMILGRKNLCLLSLVVGQIVPKAFSELANLLLPWLAHYFAVPIWHKPLDGFLPSIMLLVVIIVAVVVVAVIVVVVVVGEGSSIIKLSL